MALSSAAGARNRRITIERAQTTKDAMNADVQTWGEIGKRWACASFGTGQERRGAAQEGGSAPATFRVLSDSFTRTLTLQDRIRFMDADWDITSIVPAGDEKLNAAIDITALRGAPSARPLAPANDLAGALVGSAIFAGTLRRTVLLSGAVQGGGAFAGTLTVTSGAVVTLSGSVAGAGFAAGQLRVTTLLAGTTLGSGALAGAMTTEARLSGAVAGAGNLSGGIRTDAQLAGAVSGQGALSAAIRTEARLAGAANGQGTLTGALTVSSGASYDSDAQAYFTAAGVTDTTEKAQINSFITGAKVDGFWAKMDRLAVLAASAPAIALRDMRNPAKAFSAVNSPLFTANRGYTGDGSAAFLDFGEGLLDGGQFTLNSASAGAWCNGQSATAGVSNHLATVSQSSRTTIVANSSAAAASIRFNDSSGSNLDQGAAIRLGHRVAVRASSTDKRLFMNGGAAQVYSVVSSSVSSGNACALRAATTYSDDRLAAVWTGGAMTDADVANLHTRLNTLLSARGAA